MGGYYDKDGNPIDLLAWASLFSNKEYQRVASDYVGDVRVSTVWLGSDHSFGQGPILIFETMVFGGPLDEETARYSTLEQARAGHAVMVERARAATPEGAVPC